MRADFRAFLHHADAGLALLRPRKLHDATGRAQARRTRAHDEHIEFHGFAFHRAPRVVDRDGDGGDRGGRNILEIQL